MTLLWQKPNPFWIQRQMNSSTSNEEYYAVYSYRGAAGHRRSSVEPEKCRLCVKQMLQKAVLLNSRNERPATFEKSFQNIQMPKQLNGVNQGNSQTATTKVATFFWRNQSTKLQIQQIKSLCAFPVCKKKKKKVCEYKNIHIFVCLVHCEYTRVRLKTAALHHLHNYLMKMIQIQFKWLK